MTASGLTKTGALAKISACRLLMPGWSDGKGKGFKPYEIGRIFDWFQEWYPSDLPMPVISPQPSDCDCEYDILDFSWDFHDKSWARMECDLRFENGDWIDSDKDGCDDKARVLDLWDQADWAWLVSRVRRRMQGGVK